MNTITVIVVGFFLQVFSKDLEDTWYRGCLNSHRIEQYKDSEIFNDVDSVAECSKHCFDRRFLYVGVQLNDVHVLNKDAQSNNATGKYVTQSGYTTRDGAQSVVADQSVKSRILKAQSTLSCVCLNISSDDVDNCHQTLLRNSNNGLPVGVVHTTWAIYTSVGPFLTTVTIETDDGVAIVNKPVAIEIHVTRAASKNVTKDNHELGHQLDIKWSVKEEGTNFRESLSMKDLTHILHRPKYIFSQPNNYTIDIEVTNGISTLQYSHDLEVVYPAPHDLQTRISEDVDIPSCIPEEFKVTEQNGQTFEVFVDTLLQIDSAVARGTNLTFTFWFDDNDEDMVIELCENCTSISIEHMFKVTGTFKMQTSVDNVYGHLEKYTTFVVIPRQLSNLTIDLDPDSSHLVAVGQPVHFLVSLITTSRSNRSLRVWYGDHHSNTVSLADTMSPRLVLVGDGKDMEIIASYGEGCKLQLEFYYTYRTEGLYKPSVAVFEDKNTDKVLDKHVNGLVDGNAKINKVHDQRVHTELDIFAEFYKYSRDAKHDNTVGDGETKGEHLDDVNADLSDELSRNILVLSKITGARIHTSRIARCNHLVEINLMIPSALNVSVHWHIYRISDDFNDDSEEMYPDDYENNDEISASDVNENNDDLVLVFEKEIQDTNLVFMFQQVGAYLITAGVRNAVSTAEASFNIFVQCPIEGLIASCTREFIPIGAELMCMAKVERGSDIEFHWYIEGIETNTYTQFENHTSVVRHVFKRSGIYDISLHAINNVSKDYYEVVSPVHVQNPIKNINVLKESPNLLGNVTEIVGIYQPKCCGSYDLRVEFDFDFGYGRENNEVNNCIERLCYGKAKHVFNRVGTHEVNVYGYNYISEISKTVHVQIYAALDNVTVQVVGDPVAASLTRFVVLQNGKTMETADIYFSWLLGEETDVFYTNSPVVEAVFNLPGNYIVFVNLTNPVDKRHIEVPVQVKTRSEVDLELLHDLYVTPGSPVAFDLHINSKTPVELCKEVRVSYSDGHSKVFRGFTYHWMHTFRHAGSWQINVTMVGARRSTLDTVSSYITVQEPVTGLQLLGPEVLAYQEYEYCSWEASTVTGTNILYNWTLDDSILIPNKQYEIQIPSPGLYTVRVEAFNDVARQPLSATLPVLVQSVIEEVDLKIIGNLLGKATQIIVSVNGYHDFGVEIDYGDGESENFSETDPVAMVTNDTHILVYLAHVYETLGEYNITVNVSNQVSSIFTTELFIPIEDITVTTRSPWVIRSTGHVVAKAVVTGGRDLTFTWNFSDERTYENSVISFPNQTSVAKHFYGMSGEYCVTFNVTGHNYPPPGVYAKLDRCFLVVDPIDTVELSASSNSSALEHNTTLPVIFTARLSGSHVVFVFDYGDGTTEKVQGTELSPWNKDMTIFAEGRHSYSTVGEFKVKVTAVNPLGNATGWLPHSFWVQEPPKDLHFCDEANNERIARYTGEVGEVVTMVAKVVSGNEVKFDWKLGDQTDLVNKGSVVQHQYMTPGVKTVYVTAYNKVRTLTRAVKVFINYKIQGVELLVESNVLSLKQTMIYTAVVRPDIPDIATSYYWTFKSPTMIQGRYIIGGIKKYSSKQSAVQHTFHVIGECTATVTALNAISNATSVSVELYVYLPILLPEIYISSNKVNLLVNQPIKIKFHKYDGTNVTLKWDFGDESDPIITNMHVSNSLEVKHTFIREGGYNITVLAENPVSSVTVYKMLFILNKSYCEEPKVTIVANTEHIEIVHSRYFTLEADVTMDCNLTSAVAYHWSIDDHVTMYNVEMMNRVLVLPPRLLKYGKHTVKFKVEMLGTIVYGKATRVVEVIPSPLVSKIHGGVFRRIRSDGEIVIDGSGSFDPDHLHNNQLRYNWKCSFLMENGTYGESCFVNSTHDALLNSTHNASCIVAMDTAVLSFLGDCLVPASNFTFELTVSADGRQNGTSSQIIALEQDNAQILNVKIVRPYSMKDPVNADRKLSFYVQCANCKSEGVKYEWTIKHLAGYNIHNYARAHDLPCVDKEGRAYAQVLENDTDSDEPTDEGVDLSKNNDKGQGGQEIIPFTIGSEVSSDMTTTVSVLSYVEIVEGKSSTENRRQRSTVKDINNIDYPRVEEQADSKRRVKTSSRNLDIVEEKSGGNIGRGVTRFQAPEEGTPGESGSSGGRQYSYIPVEEPGSKRKVYPNPLDEPENEDGGSGLFLDKLEGSRKDNLRQRSILEMPMIRYYLPKEKTRTGLDGESLVIKPGFLKQGLTYFLQVKVTDEEGERFGEAVSSFVVNESPVHGSCTVLPDNGVELDTEFRVMCQAWQDKHKPLMYEVSYKLDKHEDRKLIYRGVNGEFPIRLPAGKPQNDYNVNVYIDILDGLLAKTSVCSITIRVTPKTLTDDSGKELYSDARSIYEEIVSANGVFKKSVDRGDDAISKVSLIYLATRLNTLNDSANTLLQRDNKTAYIIDNSNATYVIDEILQGDNKTVYSIDNSNATYVIDEIVGEKEDLKYRRDARRKLLEVLERLPVRDEAEILQSAQALSLTTAVPDELDISSLYLSLKILESVCVGAEKIYQDELTPTGDLVQLVVATASSIVKGTMDLDEVEDETFKYMHKQMINNAIKNVNKLILNELKFHLVFEEPVMSSSEVLSVWASRHSMSDNHTLSIGETKFKVPSHLGSSSNAKISRPGSSIDDVIVGKAANEKCIQSHMTSFTLNPFGLEDRKKVQSLVAGLNVYDCEGKLLHVVDLPPGNEIQIQLPNKPPKTVVFEDLVLNKWSMNVHQFNITTIDLQHALHFLIDFTSLKEGRLFPITVLLSFTRPPSPDFYQHKYEIEAGEDNVDIFLPAGTFNATGMYYIGIVDSTYNSKRLRPGEVTQRNYTLKLWWSQCLYWNMDKEVWLPDGCSISQNSTFEVTKCTCNHLTSFGGRFELIPNKLTLTDIEGLFSLHQNPVTLTLVSVVLLFYCLLFFWCYRADLYDNRKGGIVYLLDNSPMDQQKFEITVETGLWKGAGTTAKISIILHGEEGMSETRELISEDDRPMFERNSRDKFILSLPDSIGRIWKVQIWHNNLGPSPSWYLNRVIVRDLNTGNQYIFVCEKWLAVEEQDGKVEREFMVLDGTLQFKKALPSKVVQYMADFHIWMSLLTCPPYGGFMRTERLTVCLTMLLVYMCLNAMWYKVTVTEYRGEFGLLDVSWRSVSVGAICCTVVIPLGLLLEFLFRRSKPKHASSSPSKDEVTDWEPDYPSGKPNELESEDSSEQVQPIMTYSLLDQSILNWPNIQSWAQKQWIKRQVTGRSTNDSHSGNSSSHSGHHHGSNGSTNRPGCVNPVDLSVLHTNGISELDQASSGFEDCSSLIRPKASVDSTHTTAAPSVNESTRVHKPQSLADSLRISTKLPSESDFEKTSKAPSISSTASNKSSVLLDRKTRRLLEHLNLPYWCRYLAWTLCGIICVGCATVTIMYGYRFGTLKSTLWLQSLYFSWMICIFISNPLLIVIVVLYAAWVYKNDPYSSDSSGYDIFNRQKAKEDLYRWKKQLESWDDGEALERGVAARQRSRYLRFARPPQEKQLIEARKRVMKEKKALTIFRESVIFAVTAILLIIMAYSKDSRPSYFLNTAVKNMFVKSGAMKFNEITTQEDWYRWTGATFLDAVSLYSPLHDKNTSSVQSGNSYMIGQVQLRQQRVHEISCPDQLPYVHSSCLDDSVSMEARTSKRLQGLFYTPGNLGDFMFGRHGVYGGRGFIIALNSSRSEAISQLKSLKAANWLDRKTGAVFIELTLYNTQSNLFTAVKLLAEMSPDGTVCTSVKVTSAQLFRYVTLWDNVLLGCELLFFVFMLISVKNQGLKIISEKKAYFTSLWNNLSFLLAVTSLVFCCCFVYRFVIVADTVEMLRSTYYERYVSVSFITFWDEMMRSLVAILLFLCFVKSLRLLRFNKQFAVFGEVYRKARHEMIIFFAMFCVILAAYTSMGHILFGTLVMTFRDIWSSLLGVTALLSGSYHFPEFQGEGQTIAANLYTFTFIVFGLGLLTSYMVAVLSHYFKTRKRRRLLAMSGQEAILFYWNQFQLWTGLQKPVIEEEPVIILPPEFTMAEIEYQVDELLFRMNALTGSHGLPEKPPCYLTDSDCTYGGGDDGISSAGSEAGPGYIDDRLEQRVQKIEDNLCSQEPFVAQLLKFDSLGAEDLSHEREKQLRSHLELEIFRQLQIQRQDLKSPADDNDNKGSNSGEADDKIALHSPGQGSTSSDELTMKQVALKPTKPRRTRSSLKVQTIHDLIAKTTHELVESHDNSSSNPDSPRDKSAFSKINKAVDSSKKVPIKQNSSSSSSEKISPEILTCHTNSLETETIKKPTKPTFLHSRDSSLSDGAKNSPILKLRTSAAEKGQRLETNPLGLPESSSGSEQDSLQIGKKMFGRRSLRKTKSRGKGKGPDSLEPALILDEIEGEEAESLKMEIDLVEVLPPVEQAKQIKGSNNDKLEVIEHVVTADIHHANY